MAIPISMPNSEEAEDQYRSLDLLLEQLLMTLRQVIMHRRREAAQSAQNRHRRYERRRVSSSTVVPDEEEEEEQEITTVPILPDLVLDASPECNNVLRATRTRRKEQVEQGTPERTTRIQPPQASTGTPNNWVQVGCELRRIADRFRATNNLDQDETDGKESRMKDASLLSILCPPLGGSVWTTVALLIGWGLLSRTR